MSDAVSVAPHVYKVLHENDRVRVLAIRTEPGAGSEMHSHPDMVLYAVSDCDWELTGPDGEVVQASLPADQILWLDATTHSAKDNGKSGSYAIAIELK